MSNDRRRKVQEIFAIFFLYFFSFRVTELIFELNCRKYYPWAYRHLQAHVGGLTFEGGLYSGRGLYSEGVLC